MFRLHRGRGLELRRCFELEREEGRDAPAYNVSMSSHLRIAQRRIPRQERGERRVATLLEAASSVIAELGYEAATMSEIATRAGACIGSLYQFFPSKQSITQALRAEYGRALEELWAPLEHEARSLTTRELVAALIDSTIAFIDDHPAFLRLLDAPRTTRNPPIRRVLRDLIARILLTQKPDMGRKKAFRLATVTLQVIKAMNELYAEFPRPESKNFVQEAKVLLGCYLNARMRANDSRRGFYTK